MTRPSSLNANAPKFVPGKGEHQTRILKDEPQTAEIYAFELQQNQHESYFTQPVYQPAYQPVYYADFAYTNPTYLPGLAPLASNYYYIPSLPAEHEGAIPSSGPQPKKKTRKSKHHRAKKYKAPLAPLPEEEEPPFDNTDAQKKSKSSVQCTYSRCGRKGHVEDEYHAKQRDEQQSMAE